MLCLKTPSHPSWAESAASDLSRVLLDHAHCEKKAAVNAMALISRYPERAAIVTAMIDLAVEEMGHFQRVHEFIIQRGDKLGRDPGDPYVQALHRHARQNEPGRMLDLLLIAALVEARSCERFSILSKSVGDEDLRDFYASLLASEAGHYRIFVDLAKEYYSDEAVRDRLEELSNLEAEIVNALGSEATVHG